MVSAPAPKDPPKYQVGDRVALTTADGDVIRTGTVSELVGLGAVLHGYRIAWDDGHVGLFAPSGRGLSPIEDEAAEEESVPGRTEEPPQS
jgi:hypothetical protein